MTDYRTIIRCLDEGMSLNKIAKKCHISKKRLIEIRDKYRYYGDVSFLSDTELQSVLSRTKKKRLSGKTPPDAPSIYVHLMRGDIKEIDLWQKYAKECNEPISYTLFCRVIKKEIKKHKFTTDTELLPGELIIETWMPDNTFAAYFPYSGYLCNYIYPDDTEYSFVKANIDLFRRFKGTPSYIPQR